MKTSNRLLIITALILIAIPMVTVVYVSKADYKDRAGLKEYEQSKLNFSVPTEGFKSTGFERNFNSITISNGYFFTLELIKDKEFGVKVSNEAAKSIHVEVSANGGLMIQFADRQKKRWKYETILVYAPDFSKLNIQKSEDVTINGNLQTLHVDANHVEAIRFNEKFKVNHLTIEADSVTEIAVNGAPINNLEATLNYGNFNSTNVPYNQLMLYASGKSGIGLTNTKEYKSSIKNLLISTTGNNSVAFTNVKIDTLTGKLSGQTEVSMQMMYIRQLLK